jgi:uncharacterized coiled-coil protein SlyX
MKNPSIAFTAILFTLTLLCAAAAPKAFGVVPAPDGGYPGFNTAEGQKALFSLTTGVGNAAVGWYSLFSNTDGSFNTAVGTGTLLFNVGDQSTGEGVENTAVGAAALLSNTTGHQNTAVGTQALFSNTTGVVNTATGYQALVSNTTGSFNTAIGLYALASNTTGFTNTAVGYGAGSSLTTGQRNIDIGHPGVAGESDTIRIGNTGNQTRTFIAAIRGVTTGVADAVPVLIDSDGQLGTASSSRRFKEEIRPMDKASESILALKPVTFHYKNDTTDTPQFGLIAEEVAAVNPHLVVRDKNGEIYTVRYDAVNAMLLNEFLKEHKEVEAQQRKIENQKATIDELKLTVAQQQKNFAQQQAQIEALTSGLHKVSARIVSKPEPEIAANNH